MQIPMLWAAVAAAAISVAGAPPAAAFVTGFTEEDAFQRAPADQRAAAFARAHDDAGAGSARILVRWALVARKRPPDQTTARDPQWAGYNWSLVDPVVVAATAAGVDPLLTVFQAPEWAEGADRPSSAPPGAWKPSAPDYGDFAVAIARRYSGAFRDPATGRTLPRVRNWQVWNEPNLTVDLAPQWERRRGQLVPVGADMYRRLLNAFYAGVKSVARSNVVGMGGLAPYGDYIPGEPRIPPARFARQLFCVPHRVRLRPVRCADAPVRFDALAAHPYPYAAPERGARRADDVLIPDMGRLTRPLKAAMRAGKIAPRGAKRLWVTEFAWDSSPPDPDGVPAQRHAGYVANGLYLLWRQGVDLAVWFNMRDQAPGRGFAFTLQSGVFFRGNDVFADRPKPALTAFRFPLVARASRGRTLVWGRGPTRARVTVQVRRGGRWRRVVTARPQRDRVFTLRTAKVRRGELVRARSGGSASLTWRVR